jgi:hypothetical protein
MISPFELEQQRQEEQIQLVNQLQTSEQKMVDSSLIQSATPSNLKPQGSSKLPLIIFELGFQIPQIINPSLNNLIQTYIPNPELCSKNINELFIQRNNIVNSLNKIGVKINQLGTSITGISNFLNITLGIIKTVELSSIAVSLAAKTTPVIPGIIPSTLNDIQTFIRKTTFDEFGNSKLSKTQSIINSSSLVISIIGVYILQAINQINIIDDYIKKCDSELSKQLINTSKEINDISLSQLESSKTQNQITYQGFTIEVEEIFYTPTVNRRKAVGKNSQGINLIQTELSFTTDNQILINELKLIIDRDNLKAY